MNINYPEHYDEEECEICGEPCKDDYCDRCAADELADLMNDN